MESFQMEIAGLAVLVQPMFQSTKEYCRPYLTDREPECVISVYPEDLTFEQMMLEKEAIEEGMKIRKFKDPFLERTTIQRKVADQLLKRNTLMMHGSTVAVDGNAYLFTAPCGTGKSTHTRLWRELFGDRAVMVNDDKPFLQITDDGVLAYGSPWCGKHGLATNVCIPLKGICFLQRGKDNSICAVDAEVYMDLLRHQMHVPVDPELLEMSNSLVDSLTKFVPMWEMRCNMNLDAAKVSYDAMSIVDK